MAAAKKERKKRKETCCSKSTIEKALKFLKEKKDNKDSGNIQSDK